MDKSSNFTVGRMKDPEDFEEAFSVAAQAFALQSKDGFWMAMNPGWDTPEGKAKGARELIVRSQQASRGAGGQYHTVFLKASTKDTSVPGGERLVGFAIWVQISQIDGYGEPPAKFPVKDMYPDDPSEQAFIALATEKFFHRRNEVLEEKRDSAPPAIFALDLLAVSPDFQGRGIGRALTQWGVDEARNRGIEAVLEASTMGRAVYAKVGFKPDGGEPDWSGERFEGRNCPSIVFMRTW